MIRRTKGSIKSASETVEDGIWSCVEEEEEIARVDAVPLRICKLRFRNNSYRKRVRKSR